MSIILASEQDAKEAEDQTTEVAEATEEASDQESAQAEEAGETEESETSEENEEDGEQDDKDEEKPKKKSGFKRRIDKLTKKISATEQELNYWRETALGKKAEPEKESITVETPKGSPKEEDFETVEAYLDAYIEWKAEQVTDKQLSAIEKKNQETSIKTEQQKKVEGFREKVGKFAKEHSDFEELVSEADETVKMSVGVQEVLLNSENGPALMYELVQDLETYERICSLPPLSAAVELGKIEARLLSKTTPRKETKTTKAPPPLKTVGARSSGTKKNIYDPNLSQADYERVRKEMLASRT